MRKDPPKPHLKPENGHNPHGARGWIEDVYRPWYDAQAADSGGNSPPPPPPKNPPEPEG